MTTKIIIEYPDLADAEILATFNQNLAWETEAIKLVDKIVLDGVKNLINNPALGFYLIAKVNEKVVATLMVTTEWSDWRNGQFWWIQSVYVDKDYRRQGIYRQLYQRVKQLAEEKSTVCGFRLYVENENQRAQQTYQNLGMSTTHYQIYEELKSDTNFTKLND